MNPADREAILILATRAAELEVSCRIQDDAFGSAYKTLIHAIRHLGYPDRDIYPKTRRGSKGAPIVRK